MNVRGGTPMSDENSVPGTFSVAMSAADWETIATGKVISRFPPLSLREVRSEDLEKVMVRDRRNSIKPRLQRIPG
jgi:hypothetical protein